MALVAVRAVVHVAIDPLMLLVGLGLPMTDRAGKHGVVAGISMAVAARLCVPVLHGEPGVVERRSLPGIRGVAGQASRGESRGLVVRVCCVVVILFVTAITVGWQSRVIVVYMTVGAGHFQVCAGQREFRFVVIEGGWNPRRGAVAQLALLGEARLQVVRILGVVEIGQVAGHASCVRQLVIPVDVTLRAIQRNVRTRQRPSGFAVVKQRSRP